MQFVIIMLVFVNGNLSAIESQKPISHEECKKAAQMLVRTGIALVAGCKLVGSNV